MDLDSAGDISLLLGSEEVPPVLEVNAAGRSPFLLTCDHYGQAIFDPYHRRIAEIIDRRLRDSLPTVLVSLHSFTPVYAGIARPWHIGTLYHRDTRLPPLLLKLFRAQADLVVGDNEPYSVSDETDYTIPVHAEARGLMNSGIEIRQDLIADEAGQNEWA